MTLAPTEIVPAAKGEVGLAPAAKYEVKSLALALAVIEFVASAEDAGVSVSHVARTVGTPKSNAFRILQTLVARGYLSDFGEGPSRRYRLGAMFLSLANAARTQRPVADIAKQILRRLTQETNLTSRFAILNRGHVVALAKEDASDGVLVASYLGRHEFAHCSAIGKALLSTMPEHQIRETMRDIGLPLRTQKTITNWNALAEDLALIRARGFSLDDEEDFDGVFAVGAVIRDHTNQVVGAISVCGLKLDLKTDDLMNLGKVVSRYAAELSREMGATPESGRHGVIF